MSAASPPSTTDQDSLRVTLHRGARVGWIGALVGLALGVVGQAAVALTSVPGSWAPSVYQRIVGALMLFATSSACLGMTALFFLAVQRGKPGRTAILGTSLVGTLAVGAHILGVTLRLVTGSHLTLSGFEYFTNSGTHVAGEIARRFAWQLSGVALGAVVVGFGLSRLVGWGLRSPRAGRRRHVEVGAFVFTMIAAIGYWFIPVPRSFALGVRQSSPEFAFASSFSNTHPTSVNIDRETGKLIAHALESPPLEAGGAWLETAPSKGSRPNVIVVTVEATNVHHLGYEGYTRGVTPRLDALASSSLVAHRAYTTATHSNYAQMAIISSLFPRRGSALDMYVKLDYPRFLLHDTMNALGLSTATISSQDENWQGMKRFEDTGTPTYYHHSPDFHGEHLDIGTEDIVPDEVTIDHVLGWIDAQRTGGSRPVSIYVNLQATHFPYSVPEHAPHPYGPYEPKGTFNFVDYRQDDLATVINKYDNALHYIDTQMGRLVDGLAARGMLDDTILVFVADHGELFLDHDLVTHARSLFEDEARVPIIVHYPNGLAPGSIRTPVSTIDILPTILDLMGVPPHPSMQGESMLRYRSEAGSKQDVADVRHPAVYLNIQGWKHLDGMVCYPFKVVYDPESDTSLLFDLARDPRETRDLTAELPELAGAMLGTLHAQIGAQLEYHEGDAQLSHARYAPRMLSCPALSRQPDPLATESAAADASAPTVH